MTQKAIKIFIKENYSNGPKHNYTTNKTDVYHIDDICSWDILDLKDHGPENNRGYRYVLVVIDNFSKNAWTVAIRNKNVQTRTNFFEDILITSKRKPNSTETDRGKEFYNNIFQDFLNKYNIKIQSRNTSVGAVFAERFNRTIGILLERPVFEKGDGKWIDVLPTIKKQYNKKLHSSTKLTPIQASFKKIEGFVYKNFIDKRKKIKPNFRVNDLVVVADLKKTFSKRDTTNWSYNLYKNSEINKHTIPSYRLDFLPERYNQALLKKTNLTMKENKDEKSKLKLNQVAFVHHYSQIFIYSSIEEHIQLNLLVLERLV